jgi:hypothetical protein
MEEKMKIKWREIWRNMKQVKARQSGKNDVFQRITDRPINRLRWACQTAVSTLRRRSLLRDMNARGSAPRPSPTILPLALERRAG